MHFLLMKYTILFWTHPNIFLQKVSNLNRTVQRTNFSFYLMILTTFIRPECNHSLFNISIIIQESIVFLLSLLAGWRIVADLLVFHIITFSDIWLSLPVFSHSLSILRWGIIWEATRARLGTQLLIIPGFIRWLNPYCLSLCVLPVCVCVCFVML